VPLAPFTSLRVGGTARRFVEVDSARAIVDAVSEADARGEPVLVLGGGSNLVVGDAGFDGTVVKVASRGIDVTREGERVRVEVEAGEPWDDLVARCVDEGWSGLECLSGIPGLAGATPIQNVGAYGQEVKDTVTHVRVLDRRASGERDPRDVPASECGLAYRTSVFKGDARFVVTRVTFELLASPESAPVRYPELARALGVGAAERAPLRVVRDTVIALRRTKGMVLDEADPESVSAGSFFVNPLLDAASLARLVRRVQERGIDSAAIPAFPGDEGRTKVSAAWLIERAGFTKGWAPGEGARVGISRKHALALVNRGGATSAELLACARAIREGVRAAFDVELAIEPVVVGSATEEGSPAAK
jgi:UDP-N-acetylmuramate dehydrogenase